MIANAYAVLKEGGLLLMSTPDLNSVFEENVGITSLTNFIIREDYLLAGKFLGGTLDDSTTFLVIKKSSRLDLSEKLLALHRVGAEQRGDFFVSKYEKIEVKPPSPLNVF